MKRFVDTSVAKIGWRHIKIFLAVTLLTMSLVYLFEACYIGSESAERLQEITSAIQLADSRGGLRGVLEELTYRENVRKERGSCYTMLVDSRGRKLAGALEVWPPEILVGREPKLFWTTPEFLASTKEDDPTYWPGVAVALRDGSRLLVVRHQELGEEIREMAIPTLWLTLLSFTFGALLMVFSLGMSLLRRVDHFNQVLQCFEDGDLSQRVLQQNNRDEFDLLATHLNSMFNRVEGHVGNLRRLTADVAHDLRGPLTRISSRLEVTLLKSHERPYYEQILQDTLRDLNGVTDTFNSLLYIGRLEAERVPLEKQSLDLAALVEDMVSLYSQDEHSIDTWIEPVLIDGERELLQRVLSNLLENALKFSPQPGTVSVTLMEGNRECLLMVSDRGPGIPEPDRELVFERFYRAEAARSTPGSGLGLSLVRAAVRAHGGRVVLADNGPGLCVTVRLPNSKTGVHNTLDRPEKGPTTGL